MENITTEYKYVTFPVTILNRSPFRRQFLEITKHTRLENPQNEETGIYQAIIQNISQYKLKNFYLPGSVPQ